ncbi:TLC domain-containing protein 2 [Senna tora]|uniref:TLC domain-containing protein 2 n=1 Tax=Senna tora TaxID=362788 RepID=A0A834TYR4_9FABA|nr:TLC domain-containing protein 2 [Senna tora]
MGGKSGERSKVGGFFYFTLLLWLGYVCFHILFNKRTQLLYVIAGSLFYQTANSLIRLFSSDPLFVNTSVSLVHSTTTSASVIFILFREWLSNGTNGMFDHSQLVEGTWPWAYEALCFSCGYFAYDQWDMLRHHLYSGLIPSILVHHLVLLICFTLALYRNVTINYLILTLICELHSIFLHVRKVRRMAGFRNSKSKIVKVEWFLNWITFFVARLVSHILITAKLIRDAHKFGRGVELPLALFGMFGMNLLNFGLGIDLFNAYKRERKPQQTNHHHHE